jgi:hypothetical protein
MPINTPCAAYAAMVPFWEKMRNVLAGEERLKALGAKYIPKPEGMQSTEFQNYVNRGCFHNATELTRRALAGLAFAKEPNVRIPDRFNASAWLRDVTMSGVSIQGFALQALNEILAVGRFGVLVDFDSEDTPQAQRRPYWVAYDAEQLINWRIARVNGDAYVPVRIVLKECIDDPDSPDEYAPPTLEQYRLLELRDVAGYDRPVYTMTVLRSSHGRQFEPIDEPVIPLRYGQPLSFIPFVCVNASALTFEPERPVLNDLANVNLGLWRTSVDIEHGRRYTALPTPWASGLPHDMKTVPVGPTSFLKLDGPNAAAGMIEFKGAGLGELRHSITEKIEQMSALGARLLDQGATVPETAEAARIRAATQHASLRTICSTLAAGLTTALQWTAFWGGVTEKTDDASVGVELNREFTAVTMSPEDIRAELERWIKGGSSFETMYHVLARGGRTRGGISAEDERKLIDAEQAERAAKAAQTKGAAQ